MIARATIAEFAPRGTPQFSRSQNTPTAPARSTLVCGALMAPTVYKQAPSMMLGCLLPSGGSSGSGRNLPGRFAKNLFIAAGSSSALTEVHGKTKTQRKNEFLALTLSFNHRRAGVDRRPDCPSGNGPAAMRFCDRPTSRLPRSESRRRQASASSWPEQGSEMRYLAGVSSLQVATVVARGFC